MTHVLKELLGNDHPLFTANLAALERAVGNDGLDVKLYADIIEKGHAVLRELGLDPSSTMGLEAYRALRNQIGNDAVRDKLRDTDYVLLFFGNDLVSFNLQDVIENKHHELKFEDRIITSAQRHLRAEIIRRYAEHDRSDNELVHKLAEEIGLKPVHDEGHPNIHKEISHNMDKQAPHVLAVGDIITDAFIKLSEDYAEVYTDDEGTKRLSFEMGAKLPYDQVDIVEAVECSPNAAVSMTRLGLNVSLRSWLGDDGPGKDMVAYLKQQGVGTDELVVEEGMKSNYHYVLRYGADRTKLQRFEDYSYEWHEPSQKPDWLYLGVLGEKTWPLHEAMLDYLRDNPEIKLAFQPGMYHLMWGAEKLSEFYKRAEIVIMNREEAMQVTGKPHDPIRELANAVHDLGPNIVVITDGPDGSYASYDWKLVTIPNYPDPKPPLDRTGAGDAFASTIVAALALGEPMDTALTWAPINSMNVVQEMGAQSGLLSREKIEEFLSEAPENYKVTEVQE